jgi:hypothetical protein
MTMPLFNIIAGGALLLFGRRLFWLFVAAVGFVVGARLAADVFSGEPEWLIMVIALGVGIIGALVSIFLQRLVVGIAGFLAGGYVLYLLAFGLEQEALAWIAFFVGGVVGAILVMAVFDWALIILSSLTGATVIAQNVSLDRPASALLFVVLLVLGIVVQARQLPRETPPPEQPKSD